MNKPKYQIGDRLSTDEQLIILGLLIKDQYVEIFSSIAEMNVKTVENWLLEKCAERLFLLDISEVKARINKARNYVNSYE